MTFALETQLTPQAAADRRFLEERIKSRYVGLEDTGPAVPETRWSVEIHRQVEKEVPFTYPPRTRSELRATWFLGATPDQALAKARAWVEEQLAKNGARR